MRHYFFTLCILVLVVVVACTPDEEKFTSDGSVKLRFSTDTVLFDTVFSSVGSITKRFRVYNDNKNAVSISKIALGKAANSEYEVIVNGREADSFTNEQILGKDSMLVLVKVNIDPRNENLPFVVRDSVTFETNGNFQDVKLVSWGQDANFLNDSILACNTVWTAERPYVIFNSVLVDTLCNLTIEKGARVFSHNDSFIFVKGTLNIEGEADSRVILRNDRLDEGFQDAPGQWGGVIFLEGSKNNTIQYTDIRNAQIGVRIGTPDDDEIPDVVIGNSKIENMSNSGILAFTSDLYAYNTLVNNCAVYTVGNLLGGNYLYEHCTFATFSFDFFREDPAVVFSNNIVLDDGSALTETLDVEMVNSIVWGSLNEELLLSVSEGADATFGFFNNILRTSNTELDINDNLLNEDPRFMEPAIFDYRLDTLSPAKDKGQVLPIDIDLDGTDRDENPDLGAFERIE